MPKEKNVIEAVNSLYKIQALDMAMFGYVLGMRTSLPSVSIDRCIISFMQEFNLSEDDYPKDSANCQFYRFYEMMRESRKSE
jgi:hypothetical protein